jgi:hypothetical protein
MLENIEGANQTWTIQINCRYPGNNLFLFFFFLFIAKIKVPINQIFYYLLTYQLCPV